MTPFENEVHPSVLRNILRLVEEERLTLIWSVQRSLGESPGPSYSNRKYFGVVLGPTKVYCDHPIGIVAISDHEIFDATSVAN